MMVQVEQSATSLLGIAPGTLTLRVCGGSLDGQVVRLGSSKCSLGSGPHCTLRLRAPGVDSLHCLIVRGARGTIVRRFAASTRLNGAEFIDAPLRSGDRLCLGPVELEVMDDGRSQDGRVPTGDRCVRTSDEAARSPVKQDAVGREQNDLEVRDLRSQAQQARNRTHRMLEALRSARGKIAELEETGTAVEKQRAEDAQLFKAQEQAHAIDRTKLACRLEELSRELEKNHSEKQSFETQLKTLRAELHGARQSVQESARQSAEEQTDYLRQIELREAELAKLRTQVETDRQNTDQQRLAWEAKAAQEQKLASEQHEQQRSKWEVERAAASDLLEQTQSESDQQRLDWERQREKLQGECQEHARRVASLESEVQRVTGLLENSTVQHDAALAELERASSQAERQLSETQESERKKWEAERETLTASLEQAQSEIEEQQSRWEQQREHWQSAPSTEQSADQARLREGLDALEEEQAKFKKQQSEWSKKCQRDTEELARSMQEAVAEAEALSVDRRRFETECEEVRSQSEKQREELELQQQAWDEQCQQWEEEQAQQQRQLEQAQLELKEQRGAFREEQVQWEAQRSQETQRLESLEAEDASVQRSESPDSDALAEDDESQMSDWYRQQEQVQQQRALDSDADSGNSSPTTAAEVLASLQPDASQDEKTPEDEGSSLWVEDAPSQDEPSVPQSAAEVTFEPVVDQSSLIPTTPLSSSEDEEEESIDEYMVKLLQRVQGQSTAPVVRETALGMQDGPDTSAVVEEKLPAAQPTEDNDASTESLQLPLRKRVEPFVMKPRSLPPELTSSLAAMRDLANSSARKAIDQSIQRRWLHAALGKLAVSMTGLISGGILLKWAVDYSGLTFLTSLVAFLVAVFWGLQSAIIFRNLLTTPRVDEEDNVPEDSTGTESVQSPVAQVEEFATEPLVEEEDVELSDIDDQSEQDCSAVQAEPEDELE